MAVISGPYSATLGGTSIGMTEDGYRLQATFHHEDVISDDYGDGPIDGVQRGVTYRLQLISIEYSLIKAAYERVVGALGESHTNVGKLHTALAQSLVLTAAAGTPAAGSGFLATLTATKALLVTDIEILLASKTRKGPCTFKLYPDPAVGSGKAFLYT